MASNPYTSEDYISSERDPLLKQPSEEDEPDREAEHSVSKSIARRLYISNFLSTWKSRVFEFGTVLYLAAIYPDTLLPMSVYAFTRGFSAIIFAPAVRQYIDKGNRLQAGSLLLESTDNRTEYRAEEGAKYGGNILSFLLAGHFSPGQTFWKLKILPMAPIK